MSFAVGVALLAVVTAVACAIPGTFVVLRRSSMLVDAISHAVLPGIVVGYLLTRDLDSPWLLLGAAVSGLAVVAGSEWLRRTGLLTGDSPQGLIFPALFSVGVILVSSRAADVHLDTHAVLVGDLNLAAFDQLVVGGVTLGPSYLLVMGALVALNATFLALTWSRMTLTTFDPAFAGTLGIRTGRLELAFMFCVSITVTAAFNAAGAVLVLALVVVPPATAYLLTTRLAPMLALTVAIAAGGALAGFGLAYVLDAATSAGMATFYGALFAVVLLVTKVRQRRRSGGALMTPASGRLRSSA